MQVNADSWAGSETEGLTRAVSLVVKCPPKPMLPETTRVKLRHRLQRYEGARLVLEREIATLDVPYGETFCVQERWEATTVDDGSRGAASNRTPRGGGVADDALLDVDIDDGGPQLVRLLVRSHVHFRSKLGLMNAKIKQLDQKVAEDGNPRRAAPPRGGARRRRRPRLVGRRRPDRGAAGGGPPRAADAQGAVRAPRGRTLGGRARARRSRR